MTLPIPGCPGYTADIEAGAILNRKGKVLRPWRESKDGALRVRVAGRNRMVHYLVLSALSGIPPKGYRARHRNGNLADNSGANLYWMAPKTKATTQQPTLTRDVELEYDRIRLERLTLVELMQT